MNREGTGKGIEKEQAKALLGPKATSAVAELQRVYGTLQSNDTPKTVNETDKIVALLEERITELKTQWENSEARETTLLELLPAKEKNLAIATSERKRGIFSFLKR